MNKEKVKKWLLFLLMFAAPGVLISQSEFWYHIPAEEEYKEAEKQLFLKLESSNFFHNNEHFGVIVEGYTLPGHIIQPSLLLNTSEKFSFEAGLNLRKFYGENEILKVRPVLTAGLRFNESLKLNLGSLRANVHHKMLDALYFKERQLLKPVENGLQLLIDRPNFSGDIWLNWEQFIRDGDDFPEIFTAGLSLCQSLTKTEANWKVKLPLQAVVVHEGGQISDFDTPTQSLLNFAGGLDVTRNLNSLIKQIEWFGYYVGYKDLREVNHLQIYKGHGIYTGVSVKSKTLSLMLGYWNVDNFIAPRGNPLYQSVSVRYHDTYYSGRHLITTKAGWKYQSGKDVSFSFLFEAYYDIPHSHLDYGYGIYLIYTPRFFIAKLKQ